MSVDDYDSIFADDVDPSPASRKRPAWRLLIVDDEPGVHQVTKLALAGFSFLDRGLEFLSAYSGKEARELLQNEQDIAVILLDVVMETDHAGLDLVRHIREELKNRFVRIILRTGQPGSAPESQVILDYDINDYKAKTELTTQKLFTSVVGALRAYRDVLRIESSRQGLEKVIEASVSIFRIQSIETFLTGMIMQLRSILGLDEHSMLVLSGEFGELDVARGKVLGAVGRFSHLVNAPSSSIVESRVMLLIERAKREKTLVCEDGCFVFYFCSKRKEFAFYVETERSNEALDDMELHLLGLFCTNFAVAFDNLELHHGVTQLTEELKRFSQELEAKVEQRTRDLHEEKARAESMQRLAEEGKLIAEKMLHDLAQTQVKLITAQQELVSQQKMAALGVLTAGVAHEINNPNNFISAGLQNAQALFERLRRYLFDLMDDDAPAEVNAELSGAFEKIEQQLELIGQGSQRINSIVSGLHTITNHGNADRALARLNDGLVECVNLIRAKYQGIDFVLDIHDTPPTLCWPAEINQCFMALLTNAAHAIEDKRSLMLSSDPGKIELTMLHVDERVILVFRDNGIGIDAVDMNKIFDPFFTTKAVGRGSGLGLSITRDVIRKHHGTVQVESVPGQGSTFTLSIPIERSAL